MTAPNESPVARVIALATSHTPHESGRLRFEIAADVLYPAMLELIENGAAPVLDWDAREPIVHPHYARLLANIRRRPAAIADARLHCEALSHAPDRRAARAEVLELARKWFTAELAARFGTSDFDLRITCDYRACDGCEGTGEVEAGRTGLSVTCPLCEGHGSQKMPSPWRL